MARYPLRRSDRVPEVPRDAAQALARGPADEQRHVTQQVIAPTAAELYQLAEYQEAFHFMKAQAAGARAQRPRPGVGMAVIEMDGVGNRQVKLTRPIGFDFPQLREIAARFIVLPLIANRRIHQVQRFLTRPRHDWQPGLKLRFKDPQRKKRDEDGARFTWLMNYLMSGGAEFDPRVMRALQRDHLHDFTAKHLRDSLFMDHAPIELIPSRSGGRVHGFIAVDGAKVYRTDPTTGLSEDYGGPAERNILMGRTNYGDPSNIVAVYADNGTIVSQYSHMDLLLPVRNPTSDERYFGYGEAEPEQLIEIATAWMNAFSLNTRSISDNSTPRGVWSLVGDYQTDDIERFKQMVRGQLTGASNRFRNAIVSAPAGEGAGVTFTETGAQVEEQMYARWQVLQVVIACSLYQMDPAELGFESYSAGNTSSLSSGDTEARLTSGVDHGLYTLLSRYGRTLNEIIATQDPDVEADWTGLDDNKEDAQAREPEILTWGELRTRHGEVNDDLDEDLLNMPLNPVIAPLYMQKVGAAAAPQPGQDGPPGAPGGQEAQEDAPDVEQPTGPNGEARYQGSDGALYQGPARPAAEGTVAKAHQPTLFEVWP